MSLRSNLSVGNAMRLSKEELNLKVVVRRISTGSTPFVWELHAGDILTPVQVSHERFRSMQAAYTAGQAGLVDYAALRRSAKPVRSRSRQILETRQLVDPCDCDDFADDDDHCGADIPDHAITAADGSIAAS